jgi:hypothetical protein
MRYRLPTLLHEEARFEAWVDQLEDRRTYTKGRIVQRDKVTVEAEGVFAPLQSGTALRARMERSARDPASRG